ncbi:MAG: AAC(3) family N-acetyltransferase [Treponema sp.]|jgi:aminoglycoside 3-N-acetyltransferase|nr:AAC(3) family N-acetyltransferase [Treponema sp.]
MFWDRQGGRNGIVMEEDFRGQLKALGLNEGDTVLVHSSMKALGTKKTPEEFIKDILGVIGAEGTLLIPALTYDNVNAGQPLFSVSATEPCIGLIPRTFFHMDDVVRSVHPTHSVCAYGKYASALTSMHYIDETPVGPNSPFRKLTDYNGKLLFIGDTVNCCTLMHGIEEIVNAPYVLQKRRTHYLIEEAGGAIIEKDLFAHDFTGWNQEYQKIKDILTYPHIRSGKVGKADCYLLDAAALVEKATAKFREAPYFFVSTL